MSQVTNATTDSSAVSETVRSAIAELASPESQRSYECCWRFYNAWLVTQGLEVTTVRPRHVQLYAAKLREEGKAKGTIGRSLAVIRSLYGALVRDEIMAANPAREVKSPKMDATPKTKWIRDEADVQRLLNVPAETWKERRDRLIVRLAFGLGWRRAEVARVTLEDIEGDTITAIVKGAKRITVGLPDWVASDIREWCAYAGIKSGYLFQRGKDDKRPVNGAGVYHIVRKMCRKAGIEIVPPHALRRTNITLGGARGLSLKERQLAVGHASSATTERYDKAREAAKNKPGNVFKDLAGR